MGVSALYATMVAGIKRRIPEAKISVFDTGLGVRRAQEKLDDQEPIELDFIGLRSGKRYYRWENLRNMQMASRIGRLGQAINPGLARLSKSSAVLDVSGGDSFTDMYPDDRINLVAGVKELVLHLGRPLVLLPQTYGPFHQSRERAVSIVSRAAGCWARDARSFETLKDLLGSRFDPGRHRCGVDMAFGLTMLPPGEEQIESLRAFVGSRRPVLGLNVSGLMYNNPEATRRMYGFVADYRKAISLFIEFVLRETEHAICLIPHVMAPPPFEESDSMACSDVLREFKSHQDRILLSPATLNQSEVKWVISHMDWFCGTRMHATIAGLSTCTPTAAVSYSDKALGVFESCGQGGEVFDPRKMDTDSVVAGLIESFRRRDDLRRSIGEQIPRVRGMAEQQMNDIARLIRTCSAPYRCA